MTARADPVAERNFRPHYRPDVDGLRALAIVPVVAYHAFPDLVRGGFVGVDIFFVISGFLITSILVGGLSTGRFSLAEFYGHRIRRLFPALLVILVFSYALGWFVLIPDEFAQLGRHIAAGAGFVQNIVLWHEAGYFDVASEVKPLLHLWSLAVEEQFYLVYPLLLWMAWRLGHRVRTLIALVAALSFAASAYSAERFDVAAFFSLHCRAWELMAGSLCAMTVVENAVGHGLSDRGRVVLAALGLSMVLTAIFLINRQMPFPGVRALLPVAGAAMLILAGPQTWINRRLLAARPVVFVGMLSYPLYLWHWPLLSFARILYPDSLNLAARCAIVAASFALAWLTWRLLERPMRYGPQPRRKAAALLILMAVVGFAGFNCYQREGLAFRFKPAQPGASTADLSGRPAPKFGWNGDQRNAACAARFSAEMAIPEFCTLSAAREPTILLLGDSFAWHLYHGLASGADAAGDTVLALGQGSCVPFFGFSAEKSLPARDGCAAAGAKAMDLALHSPSVRTVVLSAQLYLQGYRRFTDFQWINFGFTEAIWNSVSGIDGNANFRVSIVAALRDTIGRLDATGKKIVFVFDTPRLPFDPKICALGYEIPLRKGAVGLTRPCAMEREKFDGEGNAQYRELVLGVLRSFPRVRVFDPASILCDAQWCWAVRDGTYLYRDAAGHLSQDGSRYLAPYLQRIIKE